MTFSIEVRNKDGLRTLHFESQCTQGAMRIGHPDELELEYTRTMMAALLLREGGGAATGHPPASSLRRLENEFPRNVLLIGLGAGSLLKFLYRHFPQAQLTAVEISPRVVAVAHEQFELPDDTARIEIVVGDGCDYMRDTQRSFDLILVDGFNEHAHPGELNKLPFYQNCHARLSEQGVLAVNLIGLCNGVKGGFAHIETAFSQRAVLFPRCNSGNTIAFAVRGEAVDLSVEELQRRAQALAARTGLALQPMVGRLGEVLAGQLHL